MSAFGYCDKCGRHYNGESCSCGWSHRGSFLNDLAWYRAERAATERLRLEREAADQESQETPHA